MGKPVKESDLIYDPASDAYRIRAGDRIVAIRREALKAGGPLDFDGLLGLSYGGSSGSSSSDHLRAHVEVWPWDDPLKSQIDKAKNTVACMDMPELRPDCEPNAQVKIYYHDRFPSMPVREIVEDAVLMLKAKKSLNISLRSFNRERDGWRLVYQVDAEKFRTAPAWERKQVECIFTEKAFDRTTSEIDRYAKLKARLDTNTFLKLRIAFLLYEAQKLGKRDCPLVDLDVFKIVSISSYPYYQF